METTLDVMDGVEEDAIFRDIVKSEKTVQELVPDDMDPAMLWKYYRQAENCYRVVDRTLSRVQPLIGRILLVIQKHPHIYNSLGYTTFEGFIRGYVADRLGIKRYQVFNLKRIADNVQGVDATVMEQLGTTKQYLVSRAVTQKVGNDAPVIQKKEVADHWIDRAKRLTVDQLKAEMVTENLIEHGALDIETIVITVSKAEANEIREICGDEGTQRYCGTPPVSIGRVILQALREGSTEWRAQAHQQQ